MFVYMLEVMPVGVVEVVLGVLAEVVLVDEEFVVVVLGMCSCKRFRGCDRNVVSDCYEASVVTVGVLMVGAKRYVRGRGRRDVSCVCVLGRGGARGHGGNMLVVCSERCSRVWILW